MPPVSGPDDNRNLNRIRVSASTARVLNLHALSAEFHADKAYRAHPLFKNKTLNSSIIIKHRLRPNEQKLFYSRRTTATKVLLMIDDKELNFGARSIFVGQPGYAELLCETIGVRSENDNSDFAILHALDSLPSLDPFILREHLRVIGAKPADCYFSMSPSDTDQIFAFALQEIMPLAALMCSSESLVAVYTMKLARKIILGEGGREFEPLRQALQLDEQAFAEGMFCWKAFIYYKWRLKVLTGQTSAVLDEMGAARLRKGDRAISQVHLTNTRAAIVAGISSNVSAVQSMLDVYDNAYRNMTVSERTKTFRDFLVQAPIYFADLSERLAAIDHVVSFWRHRHAKQGQHAIPTDELADIFDDFLECLDPGQSLSGARDCA